MLSVGINDALCQSQIDDTLKNYLYTKKQGTIYDAVVNGHLILKDEKGKVLFNEVDGVPNLDLYNDFSNLAYELFKDGKFYGATKLYEKALVVNIGKARVKDRYVLARSYAKIGKVDAAINQLEIIAEKSKYYNYEEIIREKDFSSLQTHEKWSKIIKQIQKNQKNIEQELNNQLPPAVPMKN